MAQRALEHFRRLAAGNQVPALDDGRRHAADAGLHEELFGGAHLGGELVAAEDGEGTAVALVREFKEETGLDVEVLDLAYVAESRSVVRRQLFMVCMPQGVRPNSSPALMMVSNTCWANSAGM